MHREGNYFVPKENEDEPEEAHQQVGAVRAAMGFSVFIRLVTA